MRPVFSLTFLSPRGTSSWRPRCLLLSIITILSFPVTQIFIKIILSGGSRRGGFNVSPHSYCWSTDGRRDVEQRCSAAAGMAVSHWLHYILSILTVCLQKWITAPSPEWPWDWNFSILLTSRGTCCKCSENRQGLVSAGQAHANATSAAPGKIQLTPPTLYRVLTDLIWVEKSFFWRLWELWSGKPAILKAHLCCQIRRILYWWFVLASSALSAQVNAVKIMTP